MDNTQFPPNPSAPTETATPVQSPSIATPAAPSALSSPQIPITPPATSNLPPSQSVPPPKKKFPKFIGVIIVLLLLAGGGAFAFKYFQKPAIAPADETPIVQDIPEASENAMVDEMVGWETYTNTEYGYSIKYPSVGKTANIAPGNTASEALPNSRQIEIYSNQTSEKNAISIAAFDVLELQPSSGENWIKTEVQINGLAMTKWTDSSNLAEYDIYYIQHIQNGLLEIYVSRDPLQQEVASQILSTFEFVEVRDLKILTSYEDTALGFKIDYPSNKGEITPIETEKGVRVSFCRDGTDLCVLFVAKYLNRDVQSIYNDDTDSVALISSTPLESLSVGNYTFQKSTIKYVDMENEHYYIQKGNYTFVIQIPTWLENRQEIISSFEFLNN